jgi:CubicO group peptidase (beta-lactamase class C family)
MRRKAFTWFLVFVLFSFVSFEVIAQQKLSYTYLDEYIARAAKDYAMPGLAIGVVKDDEVVFMETYGLSNTSTGKEVDENTLFGIASCSKAFTAACLAILVDEGKLSWNDKVVDHYPGFQLYDPYITRELMIKDLLCHRAGFQTFDGDLLWYGTDYSREEVVRRIQYRENPYSLREKYGYSNVMYIAAGEVIKHVSGQTWDEFVKERIFDPIGMASTNTTTTTFTDDMNIAWPHLEGEPMTFINYDNSGPAAAINTSASELLLWVQLMLNKGQWNDSTIFSENEYYNLVRPQTMLNAGRANTINGTHLSAYALGWAVKDYTGRKIVEHGGGLPGFHSKVVFVPEENMGYIILANEISLLIPALERDLLDFHLNDSLGWAERFFPYKKMQQEREVKKWEEIENERIPNTSPSLELKDYEGTYNDKMYGDAEVKMEGDQLYLVMVPTKELLHGTMEHWHHDTFKIRVKDPFLPEGFVTFRLNEEGAVEGFKINIDNPDFHFYKLDFMRINGK